MPQCELTYPVPLETILTAEIRLFAQLLAARTLQTAGVVGTVGALAFPFFGYRDFFCGCLVHRLRVLRAGSFVGGVDKADS